MNDFLLSRIETSVTFFTLLLELDLMENTAVIKTCRVYLLVSMNILSWAKDTDLTVVLSKKKPALNAVFVLYHTQGLICFLLRYFKYNYMSLNLSPNSRIINLIMQHF